MYLRCYGTSPFDTHVHRLNTSFTRLSWRIPFTSISEQRICHRFLQKQNHISTHLCREEVTRWPTGSLLVTVICIFQHNLDYTKSCWRSVHKQNKKFQIEGSIKLLDGHSPVRICRLHPNCIFTYIHQTSCRLRRQLSGLCVSMQPETKRLKRAHLSF